MCIRDSTKAALAEVKARGVVLGGLRDKTNARNKQRKLLAMERAESTRMVIAPMIAAGSSLREVAAGLNMTGLRTERGYLFKPTTVSRIVKRLGLDHL